MKIIHFIHGLSTGGAETLVKDYALKMVGNHEIIVLCLYRHPESPYPEILEKKGVKIIYACDSLNYNNNILNKIKNKIFMYFKIKKILRNENPDVLHTHLAINRYVKFAKLGKQVKIFHTVHNEPSVLWNKNLIRRIEYYCTRSLVKHNGLRFIVLHKKMQKEINTLFKVNNSVILNNGIDFSRFNKSLIKDSTIVKEELKIPSDAFVIGHIGRFTYQKNHNFLIDVFYNIYKSNNKAFLLMIGSGEEETNIISKINALKLQDRCLILSNRSDIPNLLGVMDCFVFPSFFEGLPVTLVEAQKMNLMCFVSDKVDDDVIISNLIHNISLSCSAEEWANIVLNTKYPSNVHINDEDWDMNSVVDRLIKIYLGEL